MRNNNLEAVVNDYLAAARHAIVNARGFNGACRFCGSPRGQQHDADCALWPLVSARISHHMAAESPVPVVTTDTEVMVMIEAGTDLTPSAPTLLHSGGGLRE